MAAALLFWLLWIRSCADVRLAAAAAAASWPALVRGKRAEAVAPLCAATPDVSTHSAAANSAAAPNTPPEDLIGRVRASSECKYTDNSQQKVLYAKEELQKMLQKPLLRSRNTSKGIHHR